MDFASVKQKLAEAYTATQNLELQPTKHNVDILSSILSNLDESYSELAKAEAEASAKTEETEEKKEEK